MAQRYDEILAAGARIAVVNVDSPPQNAAMVAKLDLPFALLSDPDRSRAIVPLELADPDDPRRVARPAVVIVDQDGRERFRRVSRDFADRPTEDDVVSAVQALSLEPVEAAQVERGPAQPGDNAMPLEALLPYFRGARFASLALKGRHPQIGDDADVYVEEMDRYSDAVRRFVQRGR